MCLQVDSQYRRATQPSPTGYSVEITVSGVFSQAYQQSLSATRQFVGVALYAVENIYFCDVDFASRRRSTDRKNQLNLHSRIDIARF